MMLEPILSTNEEKQTWAWKMAESISNEVGGDTWRMYGTLLAAGEMKAVKLKVLLGRCYEILSNASTNDTVPVMDDDFLTEIEGALK